MLLNPGCPNFPNAPPLSSLPPHAGPAQNTVPLIKVHAPHVLCLLFSIPPTYAISSSSSSILKRPELEYHDQLTSLPSSIDHIDSTCRYPFNINITLTVSNSKERCNLGLMGRQPTIGRTNFWSFQRGSERSRWTGPSAFNFSFFFRFKFQIHLSIFPIEFIIRSSSSPHCLFFSLAQINC